jgi:endonuclease-3
LMWEGRLVGLMGCDSGPAIDWGPLLGRLRAFYARGDWRKPVLRTRGEDPFLVLVSTMLSHRTRDEVTARATARLIARYPNPSALARAPLSSIRAVIQEVGLSGGKARGLRDAARVIVTKHSGQVPATEPELLAIPRVGPKTAHAVMVFAHRLPGLPVDSHILRVGRRLGVVKGSTTEEAQRDLAREVPRRFWKLLNPILVQHGMNVCIPNRPNCGICPIARWCMRVGVI